MYRQIDEIICMCSGGATVGEAAKEAYEIGKMTGVQPYVVHNDRLYEIRLDAREIGTITKGGKLQEVPHGR